MRSRRLRTLRRRIGCLRYFLHLLRCPAGLHVEPSVACREGLFARLAESTAYPAGAGAP